MKKSHLSSHQQSNRKNSSVSKTEKSAKKTIKSIFQQHKQNLHPNVTHQASFKKCANLKSQLKYKSHKKTHKPKNFVQACLQNDQEYFLSPFKPNPAQDQRQEFTNSLKHQCIKLQQLLRQKKQKEIKKCIEYYDWIRQQINNQEKASLNDIDLCFFESQRQVEKFRQRIDNSMSSKIQVLQYQIQIPLMTVVVQEEVKSFLQIQLSKLNLSQFNQQQRDNFQHNNFQSIKFQRQNHSNVFQQQKDKYKQDQGLKKRESSFFEHPGEKSFEQYELSPSFKHF